MSIETVLDVSTEGLTKEDHFLLEELAGMHSGDYEAPRVTSTEYGYVIWPGDDDSQPYEIDDLRKRGASPVLLGIVKHAFRKGVFMINIDRDSTDTIED